MDCSSRVRDASYDPEGLWKQENQTCANMYIPRVNLQKEERVTSRTWKGDVRAKMEERSAKLWR